MMTAGITTPAHEARANWVRLRTLILLRWLAILGQIAAILVADRFYGLELPLGLCFAAVALSVLANIFASTLFPENRRLFVNDIRLPNTRRLIKREEYEAIAKVRELRLAGETAELALQAQALAEAEREATLRGCTRCLYLG